MKLDIGGHLVGDGWINLDIDPSQAPTIMADAFQRLPFKDESLDGIQAFHVIEHTGWDTILTVLKDWARVIKPSGQIHIKCPDFEYHVKKYQEDSYQLYGTGGLMFGLYGQQEPPCMRHRAAVDKRWLGQFLEQAGFVDLSWDIINPWELNVIARKA